MPTIFTRARAARKVIDLIGSRCGVPRSKLRCDARLESDLGVVGDDVKELLEAMHQDGIDMTEFDCHDRITPEGTPLPPMVAWLVCVAGISWALSLHGQSWRDWLVFPFAFLGAYGIVSLSSRLLPGSRHEELRVRDLVLSVEAGRWISPKAVQGGGGQVATRLDAECPPSQPP
jgi:hypothetical protein